MLAHLLLQYVNLWLIPQLVFNNDLALNLGQPMWSVLRNLQLLALKSTNMTNIY